MQFTSLLAFLGAAATAAANSVTFDSLDSTDRTIYFVPTAGKQEIDSVSVPAGKQIKVEFPQSWIGNWYAVSAGAEKTTGMLGEVTFQGWNGMTYFDVSAIVNPNDVHGVKKMWPASAKTPTSGCDLYSCPEAYYLWDDVQTKVTEETDLFCSLGENGLTSLIGKREDGVEEPEEAPAVKRAFVLGGWEA
ncbi:hypothetical protein C8034_v004891 [Colletotrichum sidae]|uniref:Uncharacterized protein n=3 Tax=Colletotrichum orbiculare species complex TaxID=2707354 RepID=N4VJK2_COLOR|nr:hypothetical protein Cob_v000579 [Colletotrichum orbiculare MAFF 240422]TDZ74251.1 hypothetical protein CTRI78_v000933 [Colletotrichum trifolii]TEA22401.1 hypothetical protein C8034_v004891 [Colletotrichum sidae]